MRRPVLLTIAVLGMLIVARATADIVVVVNPENPVERMSHEEVVDLYMGRRSVFPNGRPALPIDLPGDSTLRAAYYQSLVNKTVKQLNAYWARLLFSGRATPPRVVESAAAVLGVVGDNVDAVGYLDSEDADDRVKIIYRLE